VEQRRLVDGQLGVAWSGVALSCGSLILFGQVH
jgi:hypothetical protein